MPERHHYVPLVILRNFACDEKLWLFDKHVDRSFKTNIRNAFVEGDFNTVAGDGFDIDAEQIFGRAEDMAAPILQKILREGEVRKLEIEERAGVATFVAIQHLRSKQSRRTFSILREEMERRFPDIPQSKFDLPGLMPTEADKFASLDFIVKSLDSIAAHVVAKDMFLIELDCDGGFWISDHPVILHNDHPTSIRSNVGFAVPGIQIYLPISPTYALAFFCPSITTELNNGADKIAAIKKRMMLNFKSNRTVDSEAIYRMAQIFQCKKSIDSQCNQHRAQKLYFSPQNLMFLNSAQVLSAYRFVGSRNDDFALALDMLHKNPTLRKPDHISFG